MDKQKKIIFGLLIFLMICGMTLTIIVAQNVGKDDEKPVETQVQKEREKNSQPESQKENPEKEPSSTAPTDVIDANEANDEDNTGEETKPLKAKDIYKKPKKKNTESVTEQEAMVFLNTAMSHFQKFEFLKGSEYLYEPTRTYSEEGGGAMIHSLYQDASLLANLSHSDEEGESSEGNVGDINGMYSLLNGIRNPEMALLGVLSVELEDRNMLIQALDSLNPVFDGDVQIISRVEENGYMFDTLSAQYDVKKVHRINFNLDGYELFAYVIENSEGYSRLYGIYETKEGTTNYITVRKWNEMFKQSQPKKPQPESPPESQPKATEEGGNE